MYHYQVMIVTYSQRLLPPFSGYVQIAESERARAQSFDGYNWEIHYFSGNGGQRVKGYALDRSYFKVAHVKDKQLNTYHFPAFLNSTEVIRWQR